MNSRTFIFAVLVGFALGLGAFYLYRRKKGNPSLDITKSSIATQASAKNLDPQAVN